MAIAGCVVVVRVGLVLGFYLFRLLRTSFVLTSPYLAAPGTLVLVSVQRTAAVAASALVNRLDATELLRDD